MLNIEPFKLHAAATREICQPLLKYYDIAYFRFLRIYKDGRRIMLATQPEVLDMLYKDGWYKYAWLDGVYPKLDKKLIIWRLEKIMIDTKQQSEIRRLLHGFKIDEGYAFVQEFADYFECFDFASNNLNIYSIDLKNLFQFCFYFKERAMHMIRELEGCAIKLSSKMTELEPV